MAWIPFFTIFLFAPIPITHFILHAFLVFWRKYTIWFYLTAATMWILSFFAARILTKIEIQLFISTSQFLVVSVVLNLVALLLILSSIITIGSKRFFLLAVLKPNSVEQKYIKYGPYRFVSHPTYIGYILIAFATFLATNKVIMLGFFLYILFLMSVVILLENHEMKKRLNK